MGSLWKKYMDLKEKASKKLKIKEIKEAGEDMKKILKDVDRHIPIKPIDPMSMIEEKKKIKK